MCSSDLSQLKARLVHRLQLALHVVHGGAQIAEQTLRLVETHDAGLLRHALKLLDNVPGLKWVFDTANPVFNDDRSQPKPWSKQDPWEFYQHVKPFILHVHIKDARWNPAKNDADYTWPGEGDGAVRPIIKDLLASGYDGGFSIEPHMVVVFHDANSDANADVMRANYVEYGRRLQRLIGQIKQELNSDRAASHPATADRN